MMTLRALTLMFKMIVTLRALRTITLTFMVTFGTTFREFMMALRTAVLFMVTAIGHYTNLHNIIYCI